MHSFDNEKTSSISQLLNGKSINIKNLVKYFNETTTSTSSVLSSAGMHPSFVLY